jgi:hypothetical protein
LIAVTPGLLPDVFVRLTVEPVLSATESVVLLTAAAGSTLAVLVLRYLLGLPELARRNEIGLPEKEMR